MKARLAIAILAAPIWAWAAEGNATDAAAANGSVTPAAGGVQASLIQVQAQPSQDLTHAGNWPPMQGVPARASVAGVAPAGSPHSDSLPSGLQFYALITAGIAAVGFMASRRTGP